jgi:hypothetical protein
VVGCGGVWWGVGCGSQQNNKTLEVFWRKSRHAWGRGGVEIWTPEDQGVLAKLVHGEKKKKKNGIRIHRQFNQYSRV